MAMFNLQPFLRIKKCWKCVSAKKWMKEEKREGRKKEKKGTEIFP
jgi:hypothetical protein